MLRVLGLIAGLALLLPGACSLGFMGIFLFGGIGPGDAGMLAPLSMLWIFCFLVSAGGVFMIRAAWRRPNPAPRDPPT